MNILLTNDDGYDQKGILILKEALKEYGTVYLVAPHYHQSGASMSFSLFKGFNVIKHDDYTYSIDGTPADVVILAYQIIPVKFDLIVSGCNNGHNITYDSLYSGTIGAAVEGLNHGIPAVAFSTDFNHWEIVVKEIKMVLDYIFKKRLISYKWILNINFPKKDFTESLGTRITREVYRDDTYYFEIKDGLYYTDRHEASSHEDVESDVYAVTHGYISICPLGKSLFDYNAYQILKEIDRKNSV